MRVESLVVGPLEANCYVVGCESSGLAAVIDPGGDAERIRDVLARNEWTPVWVVATHGHIDHIGGIGDLMALLEGPAPEVCIHEADAQMLVDSQMNLSMFAGVEASLPASDRLLGEGDVLRFGEVELQVLHTPGHTPGSICLTAPGVVFTGDTLFDGSVGRTDLPGGSQTQLIESINTRLMTLPDETLVYPGHGPATSIGWQRRSNPFIIGGSML